MTREMKGEVFDGIAKWEYMLSAVSHIFAPETDIEKSRMYFRKRWQGLKEDMSCYLTAKMTLFNFYFIWLKWITYKRQKNSHYESNHLKAIENRTNLLVHCQLAVKPWIKKMLYLYIHNLCILDYQKSWLPCKRQNDH